jgi:hypothetical protein
MNLTLTQTDHEITKLWRKYRAVPNCSSAVLLAIDALLDHRHELMAAGEMTNSLDIASVAEWGAADTGATA